jgi:hypothetical protein
VVVEVVEVTKNDASNPRNLYTRILNHPKYLLILFYSIVQITLFSSPICYDSFTQFLFSIYVGHSQFSSTSIEKDWIFGDTSFGTNSRLMFSHDIAFSFI